MSVVANLAEHLVPLVGAEHLVERDGVFLVSPATTEEVSAVLSFADHNGLKVRPTGGCTKLSWSNTAKADIELSLLRMNRVLEHSWQDLVCRVQAGCTWGCVQQKLGVHGQFVALDPVWRERATVGGILATNDSGAIRHRYGSLRDLVIGMTIVLADGTIAKSGGKVVKNVAGYDLCKLLTGSQGTLAIITEANFRLYPLPQHIESFTLAAASASKFESLLAKIRSSHLLAQALQLRGDKSGMYLDVQLNAHPEANQKEILQEMVSRDGLNLEDSQPTCWSAREELLNSGSAAIAKVSVMPVEVCAAIDKIAQMGGAVVAQSIGLLYASFPETPQDLSKLSSAGSVTMLRGKPGSSTTPRTLGIMQAVKKHFDPNQTLSDPAH